MNKNIRGKGYLIAPRYGSDIPVLLNGEKEQKLGVPITLESLSDKIQENLHCFQPTSPDYGLFSSLFGGDERGGCPFNPAYVDEEAYRKLVRSWVFGDHYFYIFDDVDRWEFLAYLRIDDSINHRPGSWFERVTDSHYASLELNLRFREMVKAIYKPPVPLPRGNVIDRKTIETALTAITFKGVK